MTDTADPFRHHPALRPLVKDPETSFFRNFRPADLHADLDRRGISKDWLTPEDQIEASRAAFVAAHGDQPLWVFGYGSLMWDPAIAFDEVRRATVSTHRRSFCLRDANGGRGSPEAPGLMVGLDIGGTCEGLVFRVAPENLLKETTVLWNREMIGHAYRPVMTRAETALGPVQALAFEADHTSDAIDPDIPHDEQVRLAATGYGKLGTSMEYLENVARHLAAFGIEDETVIRLLEDARAHTP